VASEDAGNNAGIRHLCTMQDCAVVVQAVDGTPEADAALKGAVHRVRDIHSRCSWKGRLACPWLRTVTRIVQLSFCGGGHCSGQSTL
jgi:hypothetical protein